MGYLFLTGATGLLGSYLLRDLLRAGQRLAVLVRSTKIESASQRIESLLARWEKQAGYALPRPVVLEGDLSRPDLGLGDSLIEWASRHCDSVMHNAASLTFYGKSREGEPWQSNLEGTRHVLEFCRRAGIRQFHHVSTAYVCGQRKGRILESELDVGQEHGNDYESSKFEAEKLVHAAEFLDNPTIYRPGIILGDSKTGYSTTFHGFYVPLKLVAGLITKTAAIDTPPEMILAGIRFASQRLKDLMNVNGKERKNYVPVDWVSAVMARIYVHPKHHGKTYHLTPRQTVPASQTHEVIEQAFMKYLVLTSKATSTTADWPKFEKFFLEQMAVYRTYWGDDPEFDFSNTDRAAADLPCPELNTERMMLMCRYAIESNFGWPRPPVVKPDLDLHDHLNGFTRVPLPAAGEGRVFLGLQVNGSGGGQWKIVMEKGRVVAVEQGLSPRCTATFYLNSNTFECLATRRSTVQQAIDLGRVLIEGNGVPPGELARALQSLVHRDLIS